jgi:hypothetical protein
MKRLIQAIAELLEAKASLIREESSTLGLGTYARGYKDGQQDIFATSEVVYVTGDDDDDDDSPDCG